MTRALPRTTRVGRIASWLNTQTKAPLATSLRLEITDEDEIAVLGQWDRTSPSFVPEEVAAEVDAQLQNVAEETEATVTGRLALYTAEGKLWSFTPLRATPPEGAQNFEGTAKNVLVHLQRHMEAMAVGYWKGNDTNSKNADAVNRTLLEVVNVFKELTVMRESRTKELEATIAALRDENAQLHGEMVSAEALVNQATESNEEAAKTIEDLKQKGGDDVQITKLLTTALTSITETPQPKK